MSSSLTRPVPVETNAPLQTLGGAVAALPLELAVIIPTYNEKPNIPRILERLASALAGIAHEVIFVDDDSPDGTAEAVREIALHQRNVRVIRRIGRRGLASACLEGMMSTAAPYIAVMDGDLQHDETILPRMLAQASKDQLDVVIGSRKVEGASMGRFSRGRVWLSDLGLKLSRVILHTDVADAMSGFSSSSIAALSKKWSTGPPGWGSRFWWTCSLPPVAR